MKKIFFTSVVLLTLNNLHAQISDVQQKGDYVYLYGANNKQIASKRLMSGEIVKSVSGNSFNTKKDGYVYTYDKSGKQISSRRE